MELDHISVLLIEDDSPHTRPFQGLQQQVLLPCHIDAVPTLQEPLPDLLRPLLSLAHTWQTDLRTLLSLAHTSQTDLRTPAIAPTLLPLRQHLQTSAAREQ